MRASPLRHDREGEADDVDAFSEQPVGEARGERSVADHHRDDRVFAGQQVEAGGLQPGAKLYCAFANKVARSSGMFSSRSSTRSVTAATTGGMLLENRYGRERCRSQAMALALPEV